LSASSYDLAVEQFGRQAQLGDGLVAWVDGALRHPAERGARAFGVALLVQRLGDQQAGLLRVGGGSEALLHVAQHALDALDVAGLRAALDLVVKGCGLRCLAALVVLPAVPGHEGAGDEQHGPGDQGAVGVPEMLELVELFLFFEVEMGCHALSGVGSRRL
jgi:hypothetical protein